VISDVSVIAFIDEMQKIASEKSVKEPENKFTKEYAKKFLKRNVPAALGASIGALAVDKLLKSEALKGSLAGMSSDKKYLILGATALAGGYASSKLSKHRREKQEKIK
jgi:hypothetical protein